MGTEYVTLFTENVAIWTQAVMMGILIVGVGCLAGFAIKSVVDIFKMSAN